MYPLKLFLLLLLFSNYIFAQNEITDSDKELQKLMDKGSLAYNQGEYPYALEYFTQSEILAKKNNLANKLVTIKMHIGATYSKLSNYGEALGYFKEVLSIVQSDNELIKKVPVILNNIALVYSAEDDYKTALEYYKQAYIYAKKSESDYNKVLLALNMSDIYNRLGDFTRAQQHLKEVELLPKSNIFATGWKINYAESLYLQGRLNEAQILAEGTYRSVKSNDADCYVCITELLSKIYNKQNNIFLAIAYAKDGLRHANELDDKIKLYKQLTNLHTIGKEYETALKYKDSVLLAKDSLSKTINRGLFETNKIKLKVQEYQNQLKENAKKQTAERNMFIIGIFFFLFALFFIYKSLRNRIAKQKQAQIIAENEKKIYNLELENLKNNVAEKNRKLSAKALYLSGRNELIEDMVNSLSQIPEINNNKTVNECIRTLKSYIKTDSEWDDFISYFEQVNPAFIKTLTENYPELNSSDIRFICYIYMNLDLREIGNIFNITYNAAVKRHRRIKEKMKIDTEISISEYLIQNSKNQ